MYSQSLLRCGHRGSLSSVPQRHQRRTSPAAGNLREEPVLDGIELGTIRRIMHDEKPHAHPVCKVHEILLDDSVRTGVGASSVAQDYKSMRVRVLLLHVFIPDTFYVFTDEHGGVVTGSHNFANFAVAEPLSLEVGSLRGQEPSSVSFVQRGHIRQIAWRKDFWRSFLFHFKSRRITLKITKYSPDFLYYIVNVTTQVLRS